MSKPISRAEHGFLDYNYIAAVSIAPELFGFEDEKSAALLCRIFSGATLVSSAFTRAEWGLVRVLPFKGHLAIDTLTNILSLGVPWLFGFAKNEKARNTFLAMGIIGLIGGALTEPAELPAH